MQALSQSIAAAKLQQGIASGQPLLILAPADFGQKELIQYIAELMGLSTHYHSIKDYQLIDSAYLRQIIHELSGSDHESHTTTLITNSSTTNSSQNQPHTTPTYSAQAGLKKLLLLEHSFVNDTPDQLESYKTCYAEAVELSRIHQVLPILLSPYAPELFLRNTLSGSTAGTKEFMIIFGHELQEYMPLGGQKLLEVAPPHLHQSLLGVIRLAESWPPMGALFSAKLKGLEAQKNLMSQQASVKEDGTPQPNTPEATAWVYSPQSLKVICSELLNNFQDLMADLADQLLSVREKNTLGLLSLFPANILPFIECLEKIQPNIHNIIKYLAAKQVLQFQPEDPKLNRPGHLAFTSLAWRFYSQGNLRRTLSRERIDIFVEKMLEQLAIFSSEHNRSGTPTSIQSRNGCASQNNTQSQQTVYQTHYGKALAIEFALSAHYYETALHLIEQFVAMGQTQQPVQPAKIEQAVAWLRNIPQRLVNQNNTAKYLLSFYRMMKQQSQANPQNTVTQTKDPTSSSKISLQHIAQNNKTTSNKQSNNCQQLNIEQDPINTSQQHEPRLSTSVQRLDQNHRSLQDPNESTNEEPKNSLQHLVDTAVPHLDYSPASLLINLNKKLEAGELASALEHAETMMEHALNRQLPEVFLQSFVYIWSIETLLHGLSPFIHRLERLIQSNRLNTQLNGLRYWIEQFKSQLLLAKAGDKAKIETIAIPNIAQLSSSGRHLLGYLTAYANATIASLILSPKASSQHLEDANYLALSIPEVITDALLPIWLIRCYNYFQNNKLREAVTLIKSQQRHVQSDSVKIAHPLLAILHNFCLFVDDKNSESLLPKNDNNADTHAFVRGISQQLLACGYLVHHQHKQAEKLVQHIFSDLKCNAPKNQLNNTNLPWSFLGALGHYVLALPNYLDPDNAACDKDHQIQTELKKLELLEQQFTVESCYLELSKREVEILALLVNGYSNEAIANLLCRSLGTVKLHVHSIYKKLNVNNRVNAIKKCQQSGFYSFGLNAP